MMNRSFLLVSVPALLLLAGNRPAQAWEISRYRSDLLIQTNGTLDVTDVIVAEFGTETRRGIFDSIPLRVRDKYGESHRLEVAIQEVTDDQKHPLEFAETETEYHHRLRIGSDQATVTGRQTYRIRYLVRGAVFFYDDHDELVWNVTGNDWPVPIRDTAARVRLAIAPGPNRVKSFGFTGAYGATTGEAVSTPNEGGATYETRGVLRPLEGLTIVAAWPQGMVIQPKPHSQWILRGAALAIVILLGLAFGLLRRARHRAP